MLNTCKQGIKICLTMADILFANRGTQGLGHIHRAGGEKQVFVQIQVMPQRRCNPLVPAPVCLLCAPEREPRRDSRGHKSSSKTQPD